MLTRRRSHPAAIQRQQQHDEATQQATAALDANERRLDLLEAQIAVIRRQNGQSQD